MLSLLLAPPTKINFANLMTSSKWFLALRFFKTSAIVRTKMMSYSFQYSKNISNCTWNRLSSKSLQYIDKTSSYSSWKSSPFATLIRGFPNLMYVLNYWKSKRSVIALVIQSRERNDIFIKLWCSVPPTHSSIIGGAILFLGNFFFL